MPGILFALGTFDRNESKHVISLVGAIGCSAPIPTAALSFAGCCRGNDRLSVRWLDSGVIHSAEKIVSM